jgi:hypothetical protein
MNIPVEQCKKGVIYELDARNINIGVFLPDIKGFIGIRTKFGNRFLDIEYHWDTGAPFGTANAVEEIGIYPNPINWYEQNDELFNFLENLEKELKLSNQKV